MVFSRKELISSYPTMRGYYKEGVPQIYSGTHSVQNSLGFGESEMQLMQESGVIEVGPGGCQALRELLELQIKAIGIEPMAGQENMRQYYHGKDLPLVPKKLREVDPSDIDFRPYIVFANGINFPHFVNSVTDLLENVRAGLDLLRNDTRSFLCFWKEQGFMFQEKFDDKNAADTIATQLERKNIPGISVSTSNSTITVHFRLQTYLREQKIRFQLTGTDGIRIYKTNVFGDHASWPLAQTLDEIAKIRVESS